ncbi:RIP metalloprotease RseP [Ancylomarina euxinus]|uniref:Zinc metalloprotease n=1 Tax=Ancylomarina euxinus TaxID=2283627 RepID=A0A425XYT3_9BACT|nr:RIP metalloprotease RseP [Ancylomarina euxinus]MCZ4695646.1 RIP metalloprotease RseP [Ancylomarina euxinus]MUP16050.1 RIP metalloprotease RseP [Ancylomarina euxinus]RRG20294.1 RIP metalloprotease RseP [Ancylomarina euxinus]
MEILIKVSQFLLSLSILVVLHELGHFVFAKLFKARVEKFYMFFNPGFSLFKYKKGDTEYGIGWIPLGGYVKISGMIDESMDKEQMALPPEPYEFRSKPAYQRLLIMVGGVLVNFILAFAIYIAVLFAWGDEYLPAENVKYGYVCDSLAQSIGLQNGDKILELDHQKQVRYTDILTNILLNNPKSMQVDRDGSLIDIVIPSTFVPDLLAKSSKGFSMSPVITPRIPLNPFIVAGFSDESVAKIAGLKKGDELLSIDGKKIQYFDEYLAYLQSNKGKVVTLEVKRDDTTHEFNATLGDDALLGISMKPYNHFEFAAIEYSFLEAIPAGINKGVDKLQSYLKQFKLIFSSETKGYKSIGGFGTIASIFPGFWDWHAFWNLTAFLSIILAIMNILPIPALDGGHVMFLLYEIITRRKPGEKFMEYAQIGGMVLLFGLLIFANANDIMKAFN